MNSGRMFVVTLRKGGVGKTTVAMNLAIYLRQLGRNVAYLDLDPQRDGYEFFKDRARMFPELPKITHLALEDPDKVESAMRSVIKAGADAVVDCPPLDPPQVVRAQEVGDILLFPFKPGGNDLRAFSRALSLHQAKVERAEATGATRNRPQMFALINEFMRGQLNDRLLLKWVEESGVFQFVGCLGRRVEFKDAIAKRQAVWEYKDREAQAPATPPTPSPKEEPTPAGEPAPFVPMVRITLAVPEELRYRLKMVLMDHRRKNRDKMTQDEYCAKAIAAKLDQEERGANPVNQADPLASFLRDCLRERGLARGWAPKAKALLESISVERP